MDPARVIMLSCFFSSRCCFASVKACCRPSRVIENNSLSVAAMAARSSATTSSLSERRLLRWDVQESEESSSLSLRFGRVDSFDALPEQPNKKKAIPCYYMV